MAGRVEEYLLRKIDEKGALHVVLIDPERVTPKSASLLAQEGEMGGSSVIMVGGSTIVSSTHLDAVVRAVKKKVQLPVVLFPNNITGVSRYADALWFMSLLNSADPYFITGVQVLAAPLVNKFGLEAIPLGYLIVGEGGAAAVIGRAWPIPYNKPELAAAHALAAQYLGMRFVYLEAGSGVSRPVPAEMIVLVKSVTQVKLVVGGGIRTGIQAAEVASAGADLIVTSTALEESGKTFVGSKVREIVEGINAGVSNRYRL